SRLMEEEGIAYFFEHFASNHVLNLCDTQGRCRRIVEPSTIRFGQHTRRDEARVTQWHKTQRVVSPKHTVRDHTFLLADKQLEGTQRVPDGVQVGEAAYRLPADGSDVLETVHFPAFANHFDALGVNGDDRSSDFDKIWQEANRVGKLRAQEAAAQAFAITGAS